MIGLRRLAALPALALLGAAPPGMTVVAEVAGLRGSAGLVGACLTRLPSAFPDCSVDPRARRLQSPAAEAETFSFAGIAPGQYAIAVLHDENGNGRVDKLLMLPREGFGFSRNPAVRFGPPRFSRAAFEVAGEPVALTIRMRYLVPAGNSR